MSLRDPRALIISLLVFLLMVACLCGYRSYDCRRKTCPMGLSPYMGPYDVKCLCIKEAE